MLKRRLLAAAGACVVGFTGLVGPAGAGGGIVIGQTGADTPCSAGVDIVVIQTGVAGGPSYAVPEGQWTVDSWSAQGGAGGQMALVVFRPTSVPNQYKVVGSTAPVTLNKPVNSPKAGKFKVKGGDVLGFWARDGTMCGRATGTTDDTLAISVPAVSVPPPGTVLQTFPISGYRLNLSVTLRSSRAAVALPG